MMVLQEIIPFGTEEYLRIQTSRFFSALEQIVSFSPFRKNLVTTLTFMALLQQWAHLARLVVTVACRAHSWERGWPPSAVYNILAGTTKASQQGRSFQISFSFISPYPVTKMGDVFSSRVLPSSSSEQPRVVATACIVLWVSETTNQREVISCPTLMWNIALWRCLWWLTLWFYGVFIWWLLWSLDISIFFFLCVKYCSSLWQPFSN